MLDFKLTFHTQLKHITCIFKNDFEFVYAMKLTWLICNVLFYPMSRYWRDNSYHRITKYKKRYGDWFRINNHTWWIKPLSLWIFVFTLNLKKGFKWNLHYCIHRQSRQSILEIGYTHNAIHYNILYCSCWILNTVILPETDVYPGTKVV